MTTTTKPHVQRVEGRPDRPAGHLITWRLRAAEAGEPAAVHARVATAQVGGEFFGAGVSFYGGLGGDSLAPIVDDRLNPLAVYDPCVLELPVAVLEVAPRVVGGADETLVTITLFVGD